MTWKALDLNIAYYHIQVSPEAQDMCTIITEFGKFKYKRLPMGIVISQDVFQNEIYNLLGDIEGLKAYIDDILVIRKGTYETHFDQRSTVFTRCRSAGLKINAEQCRFGITEIDHLGCIIAPTGIKPNTKKIKAIRALKRPTTTTESSRLIGMV